MLHPAGGSYANRGCYVRHKSSAFGHIQAVFQAERGPCRSLLRRLPEASFIRAYSG